MSVKTVHKVLSVKQPWAALIVFGKKDIENRSRRFNFRGRLLIHASADTSMSSFPGDGSAVLKSLVSGADPLFSATSALFGSIVGEVDVVDCVTSSDSFWFSGPFGLVLSNPRLCAPFRCKGSLGLWSLPEELYKNLVFM